jgi:hypothetical protein
MLQLTQASQAFQIAIGSTSWQLRVKLRISKQAASSSSSSCNNHIPRAVADSYICATVVLDTSSPTHALDCEDLVSDANSKTLRTSICILVPRHWLRQTSVNRRWSRATRLEEHPCRETFNTTHTHTQVQICQRDFSVTIQQMQCKTQRTQQATMAWRASRAMLNRSGERNEMCERAESTK